jgi:hypothetical protein
MNTPNGFRKLALFLGCTLSLASFAVSAKADSLAAQPRADKPAALPVATTFTKTEGDKGPYVLTVTNTSAAALKGSIVVVESVKFHAKAGQRKLDFNLAAGKSTTVETLAAQDKVTVSAEGFAPLELTVP